MQVMIYVLMQKNTKQNSSEFINLFFQSYKNKTVTSLCFLNCFSNLFHNENLKYFRKMGYQLINEKLRKLLYQEQNLPFLENCFGEIYLVCKYFLEKKYHKKLEQIMLEFYRLFEFLQSETIIDKMNSNLKVINIIIDICCLINNSNAFENKTKFNKFQGERYDDKLLNVENYSLLIIISLIHILDFNKSEIICSIFNHIFEKLFEYKNYKENLPDKIFSPHSTTIKCYSLFLNRFCFNYSKKHECDLFDSFNHFLNTFPQAKKLHEFIFKELISFFGFIVSQIHAFFIYYGKNMFSYYLNYFNTDFNYIKCDITLMQYLMTQPEINSNFNISNILSISDIDSSNIFLQNILNNNLCDIEAINDTEKKYLKYNNSLLEFLYLIIRDNLSMEKIAFINSNFALKLKDEIQENFFQNEKEIIKSLVKNEIIHFILGQKNSVKRDDCINHISKHFDNNHIDIVDEILNNNCEKSYSSNGLIKFSLKNETLKLCDLDYIISFENRINATKYMADFQSKNCNISNINIIRPLNVKKNFMKNLYQSFYNEKNVDEMIKLYNLVYINKVKEKSLYQVFNTNLSKILNFGFKLCSTDLLDDDFKVKLLEKFKGLKDKQFQKEKNGDVKSKKNFKEKLKKKFEIKNEIFNTKIFSNYNNYINEEEDIQKEQEICIYCRQVISQDINKLEYYGKICYYFSDNITDIMKKVPEDKRNKSRKFVTCNHKIHYSCISNSRISLDQEFECPFCKKLSNIILFDFSLFFKDNNNFNNNNYNNIDDEEDDSIYNRINGLDYSDERTDFAEFYKRNPGSFRELFFGNISTFENYCSKLFHKEILINDLIKNETLIDKTTKLIFEDFNEFTMYYSNTNKKQEQIDIWRNILFNLRFIFQYNIVEYTPVIIFSSFKYIFNINYFEEFVESSINLGFYDFINIYIIVSLILYDPNEENRELIKNIFENVIKYYYIYFAFIKSDNSNDIDKFIKNNKPEIKKALDLYYLKYKICLLLFNEDEKNINLNDTNLDIEKTIFSLKHNQYFINLINPTKSAKFISYIKEQYIAIPEFNLINLPESGIEFLNKTNELCCIYCHKKNLTSFLCLLCGNKICDSIYCFIEKGSKRGKEFSLIYHSKKCCGGNGIFLDIKNARIVYILKRRVIKSNIYIYLNDFGEKLSGLYLKDEYKLNKNELLKAKKNFIDMIYRKNSMKIYYIKFN